MFFSFRSNDHTDLDKRVEHHVKQIRDLSNISPDLGLYWWVHLFLIYCHCNQLIQNKSNFLSLVFICVLTKPVKKRTVREIMNVRQPYVYIKRAHNWCHHRKLWEKITTVCLKWNTYFIPNLFVAVLSRHEGGGIKGAFHLTPTVIKCDSRWAKCS